MHYIIFDGMTLRLVLSLSKSDIVFRVSARLRIPKFDVNFCDIQAMKICMCLKVSLN